jgi:RNA polymerase sigma-70 factor, ECF subfamily
LFSADKHAEFVALIGQHHLMLKKVCAIYRVNPSDRDDLLQEIIYQLWKSWPSFEGKSKFSTWLYRIALNTAISDLRKKKPVVLPLEPSHLPAIPSDQQESDMEAKLTMMHEAINELSDIEKAIVMLYLDDRSYHEMEEVLGINQNNLRVKMNRIKEKLRKHPKIATHGTDNT